MRFFAHLGIFAGLLGVAVSLCAQAIPTASRAALVQLGGGWTLGKPDYSPGNVQGATMYGSIDFTRHWGIEGDIHWASLITPYDIGEDSYLIGPRYVFRHNRIQPYAKGQLGFGRFTYQYTNVPQATYTYKIYAFGGGVDVSATPHINVRAIDVEYQKWPGFPTTGITPLLFTVGAAYVF